MPLLQRGEAFYAGAGWRRTTLIEVGRYTSCHCRFLILWALSRSLMFASRVRGDMWRSSGSVRTVLLVPLFSTNIAMVCSSLFIACASISICTLAAFFLPLDAFLAACFWDGLATFERGEGAR